ncbi:hypothetical protein K457DRAFT_135673 [Linnemannia elongata AG-77]|uniref:DDE Tnp4 domain-containing protein n=1 Tax=Linnemannia elongata AG-77 TaxID=1314771 RepID=A0A197K3X9_9FUNG|nr:hypothetical protein K457DRAFT_135673 [Linnemannia elongata AG-77]
MLSERKKLLALLSKRQQLEQEYKQTHSSSIQSQLDNMVPALVNFFKCTDPADLANKYPTTADMQAAADKQRYFASRKLNVNPRAAQVYEQLRQNGTDADYLEFVRMTKSAFISIVSSVLKQNPLYKNQSNGQEIIEKQMAVTLWRMGHHGKDAGIGDASKIFGLSEGSIMKCTQRCMEALNGIAIDVVRWPSRGEKRTIKNRIKELAKQPVVSSNVTDYSNVGAPEDEPIDGAIGVLTSMKIVLHSRPIMTNPDDYLVPVPPRLLHAAAEWFAASGKKRWASHPIAESSLLAGHDSPDQDSDLPSTTSAATTSAAAVAATKLKKRRKTTTKKTTTKRSSKRADPNDKDREVDPDTETGNDNRKRHKGRKSQTAEDTHQVSLTHSTTPMSENSSPTATLCPSGTAVDNDTAEANATNDPAETETPDDPAAIDTPADISVIKPGAYVRRDYGYNVLMVCDSTTRIRLVEKMTPASWTDQQSLESSTIHNSDAYFDEGEYLVSDGTFTLGDTILPVTPVNSPDATLSTPAPTADGDFEIGIKHEDVDVDMRDFEDADMEEVEAQKRLYESLARIHKRARDCERMLKARFPSLLGVRVQIKDDQVGHDNVMSWIMACATIHNLVLADDTSFDPEWETQLDHWEKLFQAHQEHLARYIWKANHKRHRRPARKSALNNAVSGSEDPLSGDMNDAEAEDNNSVRAGSNLSTAHISTISPQPPSNPQSPASTDHHSLPPLVYGDELAREFNSRLAETGSFSQNQALGEADITETLNRLSESIKASTQAKVDTQILHQEHQQQLQEQLELQQQQHHQEASVHIHPSTSKDINGHSSTMR